MPGSKYQLRAKTLKKRVWGSTSRVVVTLVEVEDEVVDDGVVVKVMLVVVVSLIGCVVVVSSCEGLLVQPAKSTSPAIKKTTGFFILLTLR